MKVKKVKDFKKTVQFYDVNFGFREPYRVLIDGTFIVQSRRYKIDIKRSLLRLFGGKPTPKIEALGEDFREIYDLARSFYHHKCGHCTLNGGKKALEQAKLRRQEAAAAAKAAAQTLETDVQSEEEEKAEKRPLTEEDTSSDEEDSDDENTEDVEEEEEEEEEDEEGEEEEDENDHEEDTQESEPALTEARKERRERGDRPLNAGTCLLKVIGWGNESKFGIATSDRKLQDKIRGIPGCPLVYVFDQNLHLDPPSGASHKKVNDTERKKTGVQEWERGFLKKTNEEEEERRKRQSLRDKKNLKRKAKGEKGANPLSCLSKRKKGEDASKPAEQPVRPSTHTPPVNNENGERVRVRVRKSQTRNKTETQS